MLYFAYGFNIDKTAMGVRCPRAELVGRVHLEGHRFLVNRCGWATVVPDSGGVTYGILWKLSEDCLATLDKQERVDEGLYSRREVLVRHGARGIPVMAYVASDSVPGVPNPGYLERITAWAAKWSMPPDYLEELASWSVESRAVRDAGMGSMSREQMFGMAV